MKRAFGMPLYRFDIPDMGYEIGNMVVSSMHRHGVRGTFTLDHYLTRNARLLVECNSASDARETLERALKHTIETLDALSASPLGSATSWSEQVQSARC